MISIPPSQGATRRDRETGVVTIASVPLASGRSPAPAVAHRSSGQGVAQRAQVVPARLALGGCARALRVSRVRQAFRAGAIPPHFTYIGENQSGVQAASSHVQSSIFVELTTLLPAHTSTARSLHAFWVAGPSPQ